MSAWDALPLGNFDGVYEGQRYGVTRTERADGRQAWLWAEALGGTDRISGNLYRLKSGAQLKPCEMSDEKVMSFVVKVKPISASKS
ncbi:hypothetical protein GCM10009069_25370 [Algimonas arctica]|uniref:Uncharacterized protein n=1 Tax=Algimonas arctica TaxID=1479486 RepID=A0A8J3CS72_9PROT|nr:hypothetical protein [Algimonas arctica]GHB01418.1 hypothetical protein GCM10009069_25370 [Algimonas arctica]